MCEKGDIEIAQDRVIQIEIPFREWDLPHGDKHGPTNVHAKRMNGEARCSDDCGKQAEPCCPPKPRNPSDEKAGQAEQNHAQILQKPAIGDNARNSMPGGH
jgi:hypothetical protein